MMVTVHANIITYGYADLPDLAAKQSSLNLEAQIVELHILNGYTVTFVSECVVAVTPLHYCHMRTTNIEYNKYT